jgi:uncharacterized membrane protein YkoI
VSNTITRAFGSTLAIAALAFAGAAAPAVAAKKHHHRSHAKRHTTNSSSTSSTSSSSSSETVLTGTTLTSVSDAAIAAVPGGTVDRASTETDSTNTSAAYEVHVTKSDGSKVVVIEDASFAVLSTTAATGHGGNCHGGAPAGANSQGTTGTNG